MLFRSEQVRKLLAARAAPARGQQTLLNRLLPASADIQRRIEAAGKKWTVQNYHIGSGMAAAVPFIGLVVAGLPVWMALIFGVGAGLALPKLFLSFMAQRRIDQFVQRFPDAIELLVRGLRAGLPVEIGRAHV